MSHDAADLKRTVQWKNGLAYFEGKLLHYDFLSERLQACEKRIKELEDDNASLRTQVAMMDGT